MDTQEAIKKAVSIFAENKGDWDLSENVLRNCDIPLPLAEKILEFMPLAFGQAFMKDLGVTFKDEYIRYVYSDNKIVEKYRGRLEDEPVFKESLKIASTMVSKRKVNEDFQFVAFTSAEFRVVNEMMNKGSQPHNLVLTEPYLQWREELINENVASLNQNKSWWQFWK